MGKASLVEKDIEEGDKLLRELDNARLGVTAAFWLLQAETNQWLLILATQLVEKEGTRSIYRRVGRILDKQRPRIGIALQDITAVSPRFPLVLVLRSAIVTPSDAVMRIRFSRNVINGVFIEDALIYRLGGSI